jgi:hypothetical protein
MATLTEISKKLREFGLSSCHVRAWNIIAFTAQKWEEDDALIPRPTMIFFFYPDEDKAEQWAAREWNRMTGIHGCPCYLPNERWVFVSDPGEVYVIGQGDDGDEKPITRKRAAAFQAVKCIAGGHAYAVAIGREVYKRTAPDTWLKLSDNAMLKETPAVMAHAGFRDIDGFSEQDIYACGGRGDLWWFNGSAWINQDCPTDANLERMVCAPDGNVYVTTNRPMLVIGRANQWRTVDIDIGDQLLQEIVCYGSRVLVSTDDTILEVTGGTARPLDLGLPEMTLYTHLAAGDGILVVAGEREAFQHDGKRWKKIFQL